MTQYVDEFPVNLTMADADHLLALAEWALNHPDIDLGPGLHPRGAEDAARKVASVAGMVRRALHHGLWGPSGANE